MDVKYQEDETVTFDVELHRLIKIEDWFKDESTIVRTLRKGKGRCPFIDSTVKFRLQVIQNDKEIISNYPVKDLENDEKDYDYFESENLRKMEADQKEQYLAKVDESLYEVRLDSYTLPSLMIKILKSMKKNGVVEVKTSKVEKLMTNFANTSIGFD